MMNRLLNIWTNARAKNDEKIYTINSHVYACIIHHTSHRITTQVYIKDDDARRGRRRTLHKNICEGITRSSRSCRHHHHHIIVMWYFNVVCCCVSCHHACNAMHENLSFWCLCRVGKRNFPFNSCAEMKINHKCDGRGMKICWCDCMQCACMRACMHDERNACICAWEFEWKWRFCFLG